MEPQDRIAMNTEMIVHVEYPSEAMRSMMAAARRAAQTDSTVLLTGETGSGKDWLARYLHRNSNRSKMPFRTVDCGRISEGLVGSELFGHEAGAFTGAIRRKRGQVELALGGTLFLSEIGELPFDLQSQLLDFFTDRSFNRVGGENRVTVNARIIAATNRDLKMEIANGRFRQDLYYRLNVISIRVPSLRERREDIPVLAQGILKDLGSELSLPSSPSIEPAAMDRLRHYDWPGNVRELRNILERALVLGTGDRVYLDTLNLEERERNGQDASGSDVRNDTHRPNASTSASNGPSPRRATASTQRMEVIDESSNPTWEWISKPNPEQLKTIFRKCIVKLGYTKAGVATVCGRSPATGRKWFSGPDFPDGKPGRRPSRDLAELRRLIMEILATNALP